MKSDRYFFVKSLEPQIEAGQNEFLIQWETGLGQIMLGKFNASEGKFYRMDGVEVSIEGNNRNLKLARQSLIDIFIKNGKWIFELAKIH